LTSSILYGSLCCSSFYVAWSRIRSVWVSMLSEFLFHLLSLPFCMGLYSVRFSMSLDVTSGLYWSLCCPSFYVTWSHSRSVWVSMLSEFLCQLVSLPLCMVFYVFQVSMSLNLTTVLYGSLCCPSFYVTWSHPRSVWVSILSDFLCHLISLPFCIYFYVVRVSKSLALTFALYGSLCCPNFCIGFLSSLCSSLC
jgi:ABC-type spermidine/putrescine transport system permease subunit I